MSLKEKNVMKQVKQELIKSKNYVQETIKKYKKVTIDNNKMAENKQVKQLLAKINQLKPVPVQCEVKRQKHLRYLTHFVTLFSGVVVIGLTMGLTTLAMHEITPENFKDKMEQSIEAGVGNAVTQNTIDNGKIGYYLPKQFQYRYSLENNDIIRYKGKQMIMYYHPEYDVIGQDVQTYYLLRDENKAVGEEVYYQNFNEANKNGFVQLVGLEEDYLLTVFVNGIKMSTILGYEETPYMTYNMLMIGKSVETENFVNANNETEQVHAGEVVDEEVSQSAPEVNQDDVTDHAVDEQGSLSADEQSLSGEEETLEFDFSTQIRESSEGEES